MTREDREQDAEAERQQFVAVREQDLADFAERYNAIPVQLLPDLSELLGPQPPRVFTAQLQERIEGSVAAFRGDLIDVYRVSPDGYRLVFGNRLLGVVVATLDIDRQRALTLTEDPPDSFSEFLVAARIDSVEPVFVQLKPCSGPGCGGRTMELGISNYLAIGGNPLVHVSGVAIAVESNDQRASPPGESQSEAGQNR